LKTAALGYQRICLKGGRLKEETLESEDWFCVVEDLQLETKELLGQCE